MKSWNISVKVTIGICILKMPTHKHVTIRGKITNHPSLFSYAQTRTFNIEIPTAVCSAQCEVLVPAEKVGRREEQV